jgi:hypothetical protein
MPQDPASAATAPPPAPTGLEVLKDFQTRFLFPFAYQRHSAAQAAAALEGMTAATQQGKEPQRLWEQVTLPTDPAQREAEFLLYTDELFPHVVQFLFGKPEAGDCAYLRANKVVTGAWFNGVVMDDTGLPVRLAGNASIEVWLSPLGVGVLSVTLAPRKGNLTPDEAADFNYHLAQFRRHDVGRLRRPHPRDNAAAWQHMSDQDRAKIAPPPPDGAPLAARLGVPGSWFDLEEMVHHLLGPVFGKELGGYRVQDELTVYTVARFGPEADFAQQPVCDQLAPRLSGLAQVEEAGHAGSRPSEVTTANAVLNRRHWAAAGLLGSAHLIGDQPGDVGFNESKLGVIRDKYFITFLVAWLRRLGLNRAVEEANTRLQGATAEEERDLLESLRGDQLKFALRGRFAQISCRQALHRYYQVAQDGLDVHAAWESATRALADLDAKRHAVTQQQIGEATRASLQQAEVTAEKVAQLAQGMDQSLATVAGVQIKVEQIEVFIVSVYLAELWHLIAGGNEHLLQWLKGLDVRYRDWFPGHEHFISWSATFVAIVSWFLFGAYLLKNWRWRRVVAYGAILAFAACVFVLPWGRLFVRHPGPAGGPVPPAEVKAEGGTPPAGEADAAGERGRTYTVAVLAALAGAGLAAYVLQPWRVAEQKRGPAPAP